MTTIQESPVQRIIQNELGRALSLPVPDRAAALTGALQTIAQETGVALPPDASGATAFSGGVLKAVRELSGEDATVTTLTKALAVAQALNIVAEHAPALSSNMITLEGEKSGRVPAVSFMVDAGKYEGFKFAKVDPANSYRLYDVDGVAQGCVCIDVSSPYDGVKRLPRAGRNFLPVINGKLVYEIDGKFITDFDYSGAIANSTPVGKAVLQAADGTRSCALIIGDRKILTSATVTTEVDFSTPFPANAAATAKSTSTKLLTDVTDLHIVEGKVCCLLHFGTIKAHGKDVPHRQRFILEQLLPLMGMPATLELIVPLNLAYVSNLGQPNQSPNPGWRCEFYHGSQTLNASISRSSFSG